MPAPQTSTSTDIYVYRGLRPLLVCHPYLSPNVITVLGLLVGLLAMSLLAQASPPWLAVIVLVVLRSVMDCLDGAVARHCGTTSAIGKTLDVVSDHVYFLVFAAVVLYKLFAHARVDLSTRVAVILFLTVAITWVTRSWVVMHRTRHRTLATSVREGPWLLRVMHDHSVLANLILISGVAAFFRGTTRA